MNNNKEKREICQKTLNTSNSKYALMNQRAQVTLFIILGIVILMAVAGTIFLLKGKENTKIETSNEYETVFYFANSCVESSAKKAVWESFNTGFYDSALDTYKNKFISYNESFYDSDNIGNTYFVTQIRSIYLDKGTQQLPTMKNVETLIGKKFNLLFKECLNSSEFEKQYEEFYLGDTSGKVSLNEQSVSFDIDTNIRISNKNSEHKLNTFTYTMNYPVKKKYNDAAKFIEYQKNKDDFAISYLSILAKNNNFFYNIKYKDNNLLIFEFVYDDFTELYGEPLIYGFAIKFDWTTGEFQ